MSTKQDSNIQMAAAAGLEAINTEEAIESIAHDLLLQVYSSAKRRNQTELMGKAKEVYRTWYHGTLGDSDHGQPVTTALLGPPGHGKTTSFKKAAEKVCAAMGLRYLENSALDMCEDVDETCLGLVSQETSGVVSALEWMGLPTAEEIPGTNLKRMGRLYPGSMLKLNKCAVGVLLLDDFFNASPSIQNAGLSITLERRYNRLDLSNCLIGVTGNLGALDGTHTSRPSTALRNRMQPYFVQDTVENWRRRVVKEYTDEIGDAGLLGFMSCHEDKFYRPAQLNESGGFATPRSWAALLSELRRVIRKNGGRGMLKSSLKEIGIKARSIVGREIGSDVVTYYHSLAEEADPLARSAILDDKFKADEIGKRYKQGFSANQQHFGFQYAIALADYTVVKVLQDKGKMTEAIERFARGLLPLDNRALFTLACDTLRVRLASRDPSKAEAVGKGPPDLRIGVKEEIADAMKKNPMLTQDLVEDFISVFSGRNKFTNVPNAPASRKRRSSK